MTMKSNNLISLFPLGLVLLPGQVLPLHIFEERYKLMIRECIENNQQFGIVLYDGGKLYSAGCTAAIQEITKEYDDGRMDIVCVGRKRFIIKELIEDRPYMEGKVVYFDDINEDISAETLSSAEKGIDILVEYFGVIRTEEMSETNSIINLIRISFQLSSTEGFSLEEKQRFLEMTSTSKRIEKSVESLNILLDRIKISKEIDKIIGGNGHLYNISMKKFKIDE